MAYATPPESGITSIDAPDVVTKESTDLRALLIGLGEEKRLKKLDNGERPEVEGEHVRNSRDALVEAYYRADQYRRALTEFGEGLGPVGPAKVEFVRREWQLARDRLRYFQPGSAIQRLLTPGDQVLRGDPAHEFRMPSRGRPGDRVVPDRAQHHGVGQSI